MKAPSRPNTDDPSHGPAFENAIDVGLHFGACVEPVESASQQTVVVRFRVTNVGHHRQPNRFHFEILRPGRPPDAAAVLLAGVQRDLLSAPRRAMRKQISDTLGELCDELLVDFRAPSGFALAPLLANRISLDALYYTNARDGRRPFRLRQHTVTTVRACWPFLLSDPHARLRPPRRAAA